MGNSRKSTPLGLDLRHERDRLAFPTQFLRDTRSLGVSDHASPDRFVLPGFETFHEWALESRVHVQPQF
jgi:hypothetical protein